jgi:hypothetical protein
MKRYFGTRQWIAILAAGGCLLAAPAVAAPPTVSPSPGYDARLQEQHGAMSNQGVEYRTHRPRLHRHVRRHRY